MAQAKKSNAGRLVQGRTTQVMELERPPDMPDENEPESEGLVAVGELPYDQLLELYDREGHGMRAPYEIGELHDEVLLRLRNASQTLTNAPGAPAASKLMDGGLDPREMAHKRWGVDWHNIPVPDGNVLLGDLKEEFERAAKIMQQRQTAATMVECACGTCGRKFPPGQACMSRTLRDEKTLLPYNIYFATQECVRQQNKKQYGMAEMIK